MRFFRHIDKRIVSSGIVIALSAVAFYCLLSNLNHVRNWIESIKYYLAPVTGGLVLAYVLRPFARFMEHVLLKKLKSEKARVHISGLATVALLLVLVIVFIYLLIPQMLISISTFVNSIDAYIETAKAAIAKYAAKIDIVNIDTDKLIGSSDEMLRAAGEWISNNMSSFVALGYQLGSQIFNLVIIVAMSVYALLDRKNLKKGAVKLEKLVLGAQKTERVNEIIERGDSLMLKFLGSNLLDALIIGVVNFVFLSIFSAPYTMMLSVMLGVFNFIPTFGPILGGVLGGVIVLLTKPSLVLGFAIFTLILQQIDGNVIKPLLFGDSTGMSPFWVLVSIVVGGRMFGVAGMVLGVPVFALISSIYSEVIEKRTQRARDAGAEACPPEPPTAPEPPPTAPESGAPKP